MSDLLTVSRLKTYRSCPRMERLSYVEGWKPVEASEAQALGTLLHRGLEGWWRAMQAGDRAGACDAALCAVANRARDPFEQVRVEEMLRGYDQRWSEQAIEILGVEEQFVIPLVNPQTMQPSRTWRLAGKIDVRVRINGHVTVVEAKSTSEDITPGADYWLKLHLDSQLSIYFMGAEALGDSPAGCLYDVLRKPALRPYDATPIESRKYKQDGTLYANQRAEPETPEAYRARLREALQADPERYFQRREVPRIESQLADALHDFWQQGKIMREDHRMGRAVRNVDSCFTIYGRCPYWLICSTGLDPANDPEHFRHVTWPHPELTEDAHEAQEEEAPCNPSATPSPRP